MPVAPPSIAQANCRVSGAELSRTSSGCGPQFRHACSPTNRLELKLLWWPDDDLEDVHFDRLSHRVQHGVRDVFRPAEGLS